MKVCSFCVDPNFRQCLGGTAIAILAVALAIIGALGASGYFPGVNVLIGNKVYLSHIFLVEAPLLLGVGILISLPEGMKEKKETETADQDENVLLPLIAAACIENLDFVGAAETLHNQNQISDEDLQDWTEIGQTIQQVRANQDDQE